MPALPWKRFEELLCYVEKPSRYLGTELNAVRKDPDEVDIRFCLVFPDLYDLGLSNLGLLILYHLLNRRSWIACERAYAVGIDMEEELRRRGLPLFSLESKTPLAEFDVLGFTLQYELGYSNVLHLLELSGLPLRSEDRDDRHPLVLAGGPCAFNPEPLADFIDCFIIGDGEDAVIAVAEVLRELRGRPRAEKLEALEKVPGAYVPSRYPVTTLPDGTVVPAPGAPAIRKALLLSLEKAPFPTDYVVPFTRQVHDRVSLEVLRGCTQGCRFCQAGMIYRPVRERNLDTLSDLVREVIGKTGYEEIALSSLSTCDYSRPRELVARSVLAGWPDRVALSLPSLRMDTFSVDLVDMTAGARRTGVTFAPEAATPRLRAVIDKDIPDEVLLETTRKVYSMGWDHIKLYFMIGLPTERDEDVLRIAELAQEVLRLGRAVNPRARLKLGVSPFVPKAHTPFQWDAQNSVEEVMRKQHLLQDRVRRFGLRFSSHQAEMSFMEGVFSRGDRRVGRLLLEGRRQGCRFDAWTEHFDRERWRRAAEAAELSLESYLRERALDEPLPWDHIDPLVDKQYHIKEYIRSRMAMLNRDCRYTHCSTCGVIQEEKAACVTMLSRQRKGMREEKEWQRPRLPAIPSGDPAGRIWFRYRREGALRFLSHLEMNTAWVRALRRARVPVCYSRGYHPSPRLAFSSALPVGMETRADFGDLLLLSPMAPEALVERLNGVLPEGLAVEAAAEMDLKAPSLMAAVCGADYELRVPERVMEGRDPQALLRRATARESLPVERSTRRRKRRKVVDLRPLVNRLEIARRLPGWWVYHLAVRDEGQTGTRIREVLEHMVGVPAEEVPAVRVTRTRSYVKVAGRFLPVEEAWSLPGFAAGRSPEVAVR